MPSSSNSSKGVSCFLSCHLVLLAAAELGYLSYLFYSWSNALFGADILDPVDLHKNRGTTILLHYPSTILPALIILLSVICSAVLVLLLFIWAGVLLGKAVKVFEAQFWTCFITACTFTTGVVIGALMLVHLLKLFHQFEIVVADGTPPIWKGCPAAFLENELTKCPASEAGPCMTHVSLWCNTQLHNLVGTGIFTTAVLVLRVCCVIGLCFRMGLTCARDDDEREFGPAGGASFARVEMKPTTVAYPGANPYAGATPVVPPLSNVPVAPMIHISTAPPFGNRGGAEVNPPSTILIPTPVAR